MIRIGFGFDVHKLVAGRRLILGGEDIPFDKGLLGHSDADVLLHAIADALLGAAALGDIGKHFPDTDPKYKDISSITLLETCCCACLRRDILRSSTSIRRWSCRNRKSRRTLIR